MASFNSKTFDERGNADGTFLPLHGADVGTNIITIPGGSNIYLQVGRPKAQHFSLPASCTAAELSDLRAERGNRATLTYAGGDVDGVLEEVQEPKEVKRPNDVYFVTLVLVLG